MASRQSGATVALACYDAAHRHDNNRVIILGDRFEAARTGCGHRKDVPTLIREAVEEKLASEGEASAPSEMPFDGWKAAFDQWIASHRPVDHFVDDSRESIYGGRGE